MNAWSKILQAIILFSVALMVWGHPVLAHGGGVLRAETEGPSYKILAQTNETPHAGWFGGTIHTTVIVMPSGEDANVRLRHLQVHVRGLGPEGQQAGPVSAAATLGGAYEADLSIQTPGEWRVFVEVGDSTGLQRVTFTTPVAGRSWWGDIAVVGGLMAIPILGLVGMARSAREGVS